MIYFSLISLGVALFFLNKNKVSLLVFSFLSFFIFIFSTTYFLASYFTWKGIDESVIYSITYGLEWAWIWADFKIIIVWIILILLSVGIPIFFYKYFKRFKLNKKSYFQLISVFFLILAFVLNPLTRNILELNGYYIYDDIFSLNSEINNLEFKDLYKLSETQKASLENKNIVYIYLESFEKLYLDEELFPWLAENLNKFKKNSVFFDNIEQAYWTSRTIWWMVWSQCGIPLINAGWGNSMHWMDSFLSNAYCMGDFLKESWYDLNYVWGSRLSFAWKGNFYKTHWFDSVEWYDELIGWISNKAYENDRGLYDDTLFDIAYNKYDKLSKSDNRFWLFMINLDAHWDVWVMSKKCNNVKYTDKSDDSILNTYKCDDFLVADFINKIRENPNSKDTIIVLASDHYAMNHNNSIEILKKKEDERQMLFMILDPNKKSEIINNKWSSFDIWATVLSYMWFKVENLWLWVNLLWENKTIKEKYKGIVLQKYQKNYEAFWSYPSIKNWFETDVFNKKISLGDKNIEFPVLIKLNNDFEIDKLLWFDWDNPKTLKESIPKNINSIYIDTCAEMNYLWSNNCILFTKSNWDEEVKELVSNKNFSIEEIKDILLN